MSDKLGTVKGAKLTYTHKAGRLGRTLSITLTRLQKGRHGDCKIVVKHKDLESKERVSKKCAPSDVEKEINAILRKRNMNLLKTATGIAVPTLVGAAVLHRTRQRRQEKQASMKNDLSAQASILLKELKDIMTSPYDENRLENIIQMSPDTEEKQMIETANYLRDTEKTLLERQNDQKRELETQRKRAEKLLRNQSLRIARHEEDRLRQLISTARPPHDDWLQANDNFLYRLEEVSARAALERHAMKDTEEAFGF